MGNYLMFGIAFRKIPGSGVGVAQNETRLAMLP